jgi:hypothetical protein
MTKIEVFNFLIRISEIYKNNISKNQYSSLLILSSKFIYSDFVVGGLENI